MLYCSVYSLIAYGIIGAIINRILPDRYRKLWLAISSLLIYTAWAKSAVIILLVEILLGYSSILLILKSENNNRKRTIAITFIALIVSILCFFKYLGVWKTIFEFGNIEAILIPLGISYFTFKVISSIADAYLLKIKSISIVDYVVYISFFPQIICGPISRFSIFEKCDVNIGIDNLCAAIYLILRGLFYKLVIADRLATYVNSVFGNFNNYPGQTLFAAMIFYSIELYADFAGYSDIVIGISRLFGYRVEDNFFRPYFARSIKEFWNRWHISLSTWLRDYIYFPLGGGRRGKTRRILNIVIVFLVSGIWHGETFSYILWGMWHAFWNILSPIRWKNRVYEIISTVLTFMIVSIGWICFKLSNARDLTQYIVRMCVNWDLSYSGLISTVMPFSGDYSCVAKMLTIANLIIIAFILEIRDEKGLKSSRITRTIIYLSALILFGIWGQNQFIYANY